MLAEVKCSNTRQFLRMLALLCISFGVRTTLSIFNDLVAYPTPRSQVSRPCGLY